MPAQPASRAQLRFVHAEANRGTPWAQKTVGEWHGHTFGALPKRVSPSTTKEIGKRLLATKGG
jgi:hypothetical protein